MLSNEHVHQALPMQSCTALQTLGPRASWYILGVMPSPHAMSTNGDHQFPFLMGLAMKLAREVLQALPFLLLGYQYPPSCLYST